MGQETQLPSDETFAETAQLLDREQIDSLVSAAGVEGAREIVAAFSRSTDDLLAQLKDELARGDLDGASRTAHALKGSALNVGALALSSAARTVEEACRSCDALQALGRLDGANQQFAETLSAIESFLAEAS